MDIPSDTEIKVLTDFARALLKLKKAVAENTSCELNKEETFALVEMMRVLARGPR